MARLRRVQRAPVVLDRPATGGLNPRATTGPRANVTVTTAPSDWLNVSATDYLPNFGVATDNALNTTGSWPYVGRTPYVAWTDGRRGVPQPFEARLAGGG